MTWEHMFRDEREEIDYFLSQEFRGADEMIYSKAQAIKRAVAEYKAEHRYDHLIGKTLVWIEVGDSWQEQLSSPILRVHPNGKSFYVDEADEPRWIKEGQYVKDIKVEE